MASWWTGQRRNGPVLTRGQTRARQLWTGLCCCYHLRTPERKTSEMDFILTDSSPSGTFHWNGLEPIPTSVAPDLSIIKVRVSSHLPPAREEGVGQGATLAVKRVPVIVEQAVKRHSDIAPSCRPFVVCRHSTEIQGGCVAPCFEGMTQDVVHQTVGQAGGQRRGWVAVDTVEKSQSHIFVWDTFKKEQKKKTSKQPWLISVCNKWVWAKTTSVWQETHLHVRSVLCHFKPERAYLFLLRLLLLLSLSSLPIISGKEHRGVNMSLMVSLSGRYDAQMTKGKVSRGWPWREEDEYRSPRFPGAHRTAASLWSPAQSHLWCAVYPCAGQEEGGSHIYPTSPGHTHTHTHTHVLNREHLEKPLPWNDPFLKAKTVCIDELTSAG